MSEFSHVKVRLEASAPDPVTEIFVVDHAHRLAQDVATGRPLRGVGRIEGDLTPGLYKVKFKTADVVEEKLVSVDPNQSTCHVEAGVPDFYSPSPLQNTRAANPEHARAAKKLSQAVFKSLGHGGELFLFLRDTEGKEPPKSLGNIELILPDKGGGFPLREYLEMGPGYAGINLELNQGTHRLRAAIGSVGKVEMPVFVAPGWQTQVFIAIRPLTEQARVRLPVLLDAAVFLSRRGRGFTGDQRLLRATEIARQSLTTNRPIIHGEIIEMLLSGKFENPMMGLYALHLLLARRNGDNVPWAEILGNLEHLLPGCPDLEALRLGLVEKGLVKGNGERFVFRNPPMLRASWTIVSRFAATQEDAVPRGSLSDRIANRIIGSGPWMIWKGLSDGRPMGGGPGGGEFQHVTPMATEPASPLDRIGPDIDEPVAHIERTPELDWALLLSTVMRRFESLPGLIDKANLTDYEATFLQSLVQRGSEGFELRYKGVPDSELTRSVARAFSFPLSTSTRILGALKRKLANELRRPRGDTGMERGAA